MYASQQNRCVADAPATNSAGQAIALIALASRACRRASAAVVWFIVHVSLDRTSSLYRVESMVGFLCIISVTHRNERDSICIRDQWYTQHGTRHHWRGRVGGRWRAAAACAPVSGTVKTCRERVSASSLSKDLNLIFLGVSIGKSHDALPMV